MRRDASQPLRKYILSPHATSPFPDEIDSHRRSQAKCIKESASARKNPLIHGRLSILSWLLWYLGRPTRETARRRVLMGEMDRPCLSNATRLPSIPQTGGFQVLRTSRFWISDSGGFSTPQVWIMCNAYCRCGPFPMLSCVLVLDKKT